MSFAVNRKQMNHGTWVQSGEWLFEEFMFDDNCFGRAKVEYRPVRDVGRSGDPTETFVRKAQVTEIILLDEQLNEVFVWHPGDDVEDGLVEKVHEMIAAVKDAFNDDLHRVIEAEDVNRE